MVNKSRSFSQDNPNAWRNPWVIGWIALIAFVLVVNIAMITIAFVSNPGLVVDDYYERGQNYEKTITEQLAAREKLGWSYKTDFPSNPQMGRGEMYRLNMVDAEGVPLSHATVTTHLYRPSDAKADFDVTMDETVPGVYEAKINFPLKGIWEIVVYVTRGDDEYSFTRRASIVTP